MRISGGSARHLAGERAAEADAVRRLGELQIGLDVEVEQRHRGFRLVLVERRERGAEARDIAIDDGHAELGLRRKMIVDARLGEAERVRDILIAEGAVAARLDQRLGEVEDLPAVADGARPFARGTGSRHDRLCITPLALAENGIALADSRHAQPLAGHRHQAATVADAEISPEQRWMRRANGSAVCGNQVHHGRPVV
jgi:hypothetical protein